MEIMGLIRSLLGSLSSRRRLFEQALRQRKILAVLLYLELLGAETAKGRAL